MNPGKSLALALSWLVPVARVVTEQCAEEQRAVALGAVEYAAGLVVWRWTWQAVEIAAVLSGEREWCVVEADCLEVMGWLPDKRVAHVIVDPPYSEHVHAKVRRGGSTHLPEEAVPGRPKRATISSAAVLGFDALRPGQREALARQFSRLTRRWVLAFSDQEGARLWMEANLAAGLEHVRVGQWVKLNATPQFTGDRPASGAEAVVIAHPPGRKRWNGGGAHAVWVHAVVIDRAGNGERVHTTQKPLPLMLKLVEQFTDPGEVILDAFAGSGTTGVAALRLGRRVVLIERDAEYVAVARERMAAEENGQSLAAARAGQMVLW